jgi:FG-GAP-like repeat/RTX calcium-binding nonapeptide repeat (4 copies)
VSKYPAPEKPTIEQLERRALLSTVSFATHVDTGTGGDSQAIAVADLNGDGIPDVIVANKGDNDITVATGNGDGTFNPIHNYYTQYYPDALAVADLNGDGRPDVIAANNTSNSLSIFLNNDSGNFNGSSLAPQTIVPVGQHPESIGVGDFNGDGKVDLVTANYADNDISILIGNGDGTFQPQQTIPVAHGPTSVAVGDFAGDGIDDIVVTSLSTHSVQVLMGNGNGTFKPAQTLQVGNDPESVAVGDLTGDGILDIVTANALDDTVSVLLGNGNGTFKPAEAVSVGTGPYCAPVSVTIADVNADGIPDLVTADGNFNYAIGNTVSVMLGNGDGTFGPPQSFTVGNQPSGVAALDVNGDGLDDIVTSNAYDGSLSLLLNNTVDQRLPGFAFNKGVLTLVGDPNSPDSFRVNIGNANLVARVNGYKRAYSASVVSQVVVLGGPFSDSIFIGPGVPAAQVNGGQGNDTIVAENSVSDTLQGGRGADSITAQNAAGYDLLVGGRGNDTLIGGSGRDTIAGMAGYDSIVGGIGSSLLEGGQAGDTIFGGISATDAGLDTIFGGRGLDSILSGPTDQVQAGAGSDTVQVA